MRRALLLPGFVDAHVHPVQGGLERLGCDLSELPADRDAYLAHVASYAAEHPDQDWILGGGWAMAAFPGGLPTAAALDKVVAGPPGLPRQPRPPRRVGQHRGAAARRHHRAHARTRPTAASTATPSGDPTGVLHEGAMDLVARASSRRRRTTS